ncbi:hypothetical protein AB0L10_07880 [Streptomyces flaveolus]|uniref:hypothetical protein n=1 Tax=Streptomyces flaveolus TaxID=67297 RepID=UPI00342B5729
MSRVLAHRPAREVRQQQPLRRHQADEVRVTAVHAEDRAAYDPDPGLGDHPVGGDVPAEGGLAGEAGGVVAAVGGDPGERVRLAVR